ncbi:MAG: amidohydrolase [Acidobacteria bacterium]|nr:MAG: amidohydrolase [Acidobacteriota bacterium]REK06401.1 MAG: amidohydrolase [Acidobacteriota bacterium]
MEPAGADELPVADRVFFGGPVITVDQGDRVVEAVAISGGRIVAVGAREEVLALAGPDTVRSDLAGRALIPGFHDAHSHLVLAGEVRRFMADLTSPPVGSRRSIGDLVEALRQRAATTAEDEWIVGMGYDDTLLAEKRHPNRRDLDRVSRDRPVVAIHVSAHLFAVNSKALELAGIHRETPQPPGGLIRRDADGEPNGVLEEIAAFGPVFSQMPPRPPEERLAAIREMAAVYAAAGVTTAQNGSTSLQQLRDLYALSAAGELPLRVVALPDVATAAALVEGQFRLDPAVADRFEIGAVKIVADGSIQGYTGYLSQPYHTPPADAVAGDGESAATRGYPLMPREQLQALIANLHDSGFQLAIHGNGDAAIDDVLTGLEAAFAATPRVDPRPILIHAQMARDDQLDAMARLGVVPSFFVLHTYYWGDRHRDVFLGPQRAERISPTGSALERGLAFTIHTDAPIVPMEPLRLVWSATQRRTASGRVLGEEQRIPLRAALRAATFAAAYQHFQEDRLGSIEPGKLADLVVLSADPLADPARVHELRVEETIVGGQTVYARYQP